MPSAAELRGDLIPLFLLRYDRPSTRRSYRSALVGFFGTDAVTLEMAREVRSPAVSQYVAALGEAGYAASSISARLSVLRAFYGWIIAVGALHHNPADPALVRRVPLDDWRYRHVRVLTLDEARALVDHADPDTRTGTRDRALLRVLIKGCLRRGEAVGLDFEHVRRVGGHWTLTIPQAKGGANQYVKASDDVVASLAAVRERYGWESGPVFRCLQRGPRYGQRLAPASVGRVVKRAAERAGLPPISPHVLRHSGCTLAIEGGASIQQVQTHARHKNVGTTMVYVHQRDRLGDSAGDYINL